jgi:O-antigen/teichoic acid export membrane protein
MSKTSNKLIQNTFYLNLSSVLSKFLGIISSAIIARALGKTEYGQYTLFFAIAGIIVMLTDFGTLTYIIKEVAKQKDRAAWWLRQSLTLQTVLILPIAILMTVIVAVLRINPATKLVLILSLLLAYSRQLFRTADSFFSAFEELKYSAVWEFVFSAYLVVTFIALRNAGRLDINAAMLNNILGLFLVSVLSLVMLSRKFCPINKIFILPERSLIAEGCPFMLAQAAAVLYTQADVLLLRWLKGPSATGYFGAAVTVYAGLSFLIVNISRAVYPVFSRLHKESLPRFADYANEILWFIMILLIPLTAGGIFLSKPLITFIFGASFEPSARVFPLMLIAFALQFLGSFVMVLLQSADLQRDIVKINWAGLALTVAAALPLIVNYSFFGAAMTRVISGGFIFICCLLLVFKKVVKLRVSAKFLKPVLASALMLLCMKLFYTRYFPVNLAIGLFTYAVSIVALKTFNRQELGLFADLFQKNKGAQI